MLRASADWTALDRDDHGALGRRCLVRCSNAHATGAQTIEPCFRQDTEWQKIRTNNITYYATRRLSQRLAYFHSGACSALPLTCKHVEGTRCVPVAVLACTRMKSDNGNRPTESVCGIDTVLAFMCLAERCSCKCFPVHAFVRACGHRYVSTPINSIHPHVGRQCGWHTAFLIGISLTKYDDRSSMPHFDPGKGSLHGLVTGEQTWLPPSMSMNGFVVGSYETYGELSELQWS